jgi:hypothetical protein
MKATQYFESLGRSLVSQGLPTSIVRERRKAWPKWAQDAFIRGTLWQLNTTEEFAMHLEDAINEETNE